MQHHSSSSSFPNTGKISSRSKQKEVVQHTSMDPASFKTIIEQSKHDMVEYRKQKPLDPKQNQSKQVWRDFLDRNAKKRKKRTKRPKFVWERKLHDAHVAQKKFINSINDLTRVMKIDDYPHK
jgi:hypothetical protein